MYRYLHQRNHLCSIIKLNIKHKRTQTINSHRNTKPIFWGCLGVMDHTRLQKYRIYSSKKNYFRLWILAEGTVLLAKQWVALTVYGTFVYREHSNGNSNL